MGALFMIISTTSSASNQCKHLSCAIPKICLTAWFAHSVCSLARGQYAAVIFYLMSSLKHNSAHEAEESWGAAVDISGNAMMFDDVCDEEFSCCIGCCV